MFLFYCYRVGSRVIKSVCGYIYTTNELDVILCSEGASSFLSGHKWKTKFSFVMVYVTISVFVVIGQKGENAQNEWVWNHFLGFTRVWW